MQWSATDHKTTVPVRQIAVAVKTLSVVMNLRRPLDIL